MRTELAHALIELFRRGARTPLDEGAFDGFALAVFRWQFESNPVYRRFAEGRGRTPESVASWREVPPVPSAAFKTLPLVSGDPGEVERVFRTSGTSRGSRTRGEHHVASLQLYRESLLPAFQASLLPDGARLPFLSLLPPPARLPDSSLSFMVGTAAEAFGAEGSEWFADPARGLDAPGLARALAAHEAAGRPALLVGTALAFLGWLETAEREGWRYRLAPASRLMETGGFKGSSRRVSREELYGRLARRLGLGVERMVNEYGMTELLSQYYEPVLREGEEASTSLEGLPLRRHLPPPWMRFQVLDPVTLETVPEGQRGLLCHFDLANLHSVAAVLTEDVGEQVGEGLRLHGRSADAEPRGCSIAMDELLSAAEDA